MSINSVELLDAARAAADLAHAPYSNFRVGAALLFDDGQVVTGANVENASYGLSLCGETVAVARAMSEGRRGGLVAVAISGPDADEISPCGRCRQVLTELAGLDGSDPLVLGEGRSGVREWRLSHLLPDSFGPAALS
ncbi:cytidine deaminase [Alteraurantiacibacter aestuarii]|uniref:Cytidine deaminase n=1 Tax=Alteraurantiacibacter aestuarii TaxID=650004 RepID=A0A844ZPV8_9SPHN|nr:cytidine deaminase [Alteraurantiacibacter aestuarii]MXO89090.1 cytidine deaminase [Alteraurantiacibacter aestuarii]